MMDRETAFAYYRLPARFALATPAETAKADRQERLVLFKYEMRQFVASL